MGEHSHTKDGRTMEQKLATMKRIDFLKFHQTVPLSPQGSKQIEHVKRFGTLGGGASSKSLSGRTNTFSAEGTRATPHAAYGISP